jgi:hypothetical protein
MSDTPLSLKFEGSDLGPSALRSREIAELITAFEDSIAAIVLRRSPEIKRDMIRVSLVGIQEGSTELSFSPNLPLLTISAAQELADAIKRNVFFDLPSAAIEGMRDIVRFVKSRNAQARLRIGTTESQVEVAITPYLDVFSTTQLTGFTTLYGDVLRLGGLEPKVEFKPISGRVLYCPASKDVVLRLRDHLYQQVAAEGEAVWDGMTLEVTRFEILDFEPIEVEGMSEGLKELKDQFGHYFDQIDDVDAWVSAVRRGDV